MANKLITGRSPKGSFVSFTTTAFAIGALIGMTACNPNTLPVAENFPTIEQPVVESAAQWQLIATDIWKQVDATLENAGFHESTIGLESPAQQTQFTKAMDGFLFTEAVDHGVGVTPDARFTLTYSVQIIHYEPLPGTATTTSSTSGNDGWSGNDQTSEMVLTISVTDSSSVRIRESKVYYIDDADSGLYEIAKNAADEKISNSPLVASNWYAANPHDVEPLARAQANTFALMVDPGAGPIHSVNEATPVAAAHCGKVGMTQAKYMGQSFPTNDRNQIRLEYQCM